MFVQRNENQKEKPNMAVEQNVGRIKAMTPLKFYPVQEFEQDTTLTGEKGMEMEQCL